MEHQGVLVEAMSDDPDFEYLTVDSTVVGARQHGAALRYIWPFAAWDFLRGSR
jgi:hypothetical protein